jgi:oligoribonuclease NrnB/cAMP/cGMP phosphodiesterase (DHH superfamily)
MITDEQIQNVRDTFNFNTQSRVLNITHKDLDGVGCSIVLRNCFKNIKFMTANYSYVDALLEKIDYSQYDIVIMTDVSPVEYKFKENDNILLLDHHDTAMVHHDPKNLKFVINGDSATKLVQTFFERYYNVKLDYLDTLVDAINDYDMWIQENKYGKILNELYLKYWDEGFIKRFKNGLDKITDEEEEYLKRKANEFQEIYNDLDIWDFDNMKMCMFSTIYYTNEICDRLLTKEGYKVVINKNPKTKRCSMRSNIEGLHIGHLLQDLGYGGGHKAAGGFTEEDLIKFQEKIQTIEKKIYNEHPEIRN